jgi:hypothetical protein
MFGRAGSEFRLKRLGLELGHLRYVAAVPPRPTCPSHLTGRD